MSINYVLRDFPCMKELEAERHVPGYSWSPASDTFDARCAAISRRLFGITEEDTERDYPNEPYLPYGVEDEQDQAELDQFKAQLAEYESWEQHFQVTEYPFGASRIVYEMLGWDVSDGEGDEFGLLGHFSRQIVAATKGLLGHLPDSDAQKASMVEVDAEQWGDRLFEEADQFARQKRGRR